MQIGINWNSPTALPLIQNVLEERKADFCEILVDNFLHLPPSSIRESLGDHPVAFHIMNSRFLERDLQELKSIAARLRVWIAELSPLYVSDHLAHFTFQSRVLPFPEELDYSSSLESSTECVKIWQELLGTKLHLENFPSVRLHGRQQPEFLGELCKRTDAGLLLDLSNAMISVRNCGASLSDWLELASTAQHLHAAGFEEVSTGAGILCMDSHDRRLDLSVLELIRTVNQSTHFSGDRTLVIERDFNLEPTSVASDLILTRECIQ